MRFKSFFQAGFECATGYNRHSQYIDQISATQHDIAVADDYKRLRLAGLRTAREGVRWNLVQRGGRFDFSSLEPFLAAATLHGIELIHDLFHFGYPDDIDLFSADFPRRFAEYCYAVADFISRQTDEICYFTPVNEPSYFSWAAGEVGWFAPHQTGRSWELKRRLIEAAIQGINAIRCANPAARIVNVDPICHITARPDRPDVKDEVEYFNNHVVFQSWDMLCGKLEPELGGSPRHLDIVGINYYWTNQWEWGAAGHPLDRDDPRRCSVADLIRKVWQRYGADILVSETSEIGHWRAPWVRELASGAKEVLKENIPLRGICLYPILGMPEWHAPHEWTHMGLWNLEPRQGRLVRVPEKDMMRALQEAHEIEWHLEQRDFVAAACTD